MNFYDEEIYLAVQKAAQLANQKAGQLMIAATNYPGQSEAEAAYRKAAGALNEIADDLARLQS